MSSIETTRLLLRTWNPDDLPTFQAMNADSAVMRYFPATMTKEQTNQFYKAIQQEFNEYGYGLYATEAKETGEFIGFIGFHRATFEADFTPCVEIGYRLKQSAWGNGYATEGAHACLDHGFRELGFDEVYSFTAKVNAPSQKVMEKIGLQFVREFGHPKVEPASVLHSHVLYRKTRSQFFQ